MGKFVETLKFLLNELQNEKCKEECDYGVPVKHFYMALFLSDWKHAIDNNYKTLFNKEWERHNNEPYLRDIKDYIEKNKGKEFKLTGNNSKYDRVFLISYENEKNKLEKSAIDSMQKVAEDYKSIGGDNFEALVQSTYPLMSWSPKNSKLDLREISKEYREIVSPVAA